MSKQPLDVSKRFVDVTQKQNFVVWMKDKLRNSRNLSDVSSLITLVNSGNTYHLAHLGIFSLDGVPVKDIIYAGQVSGLELSKVNFSDSLKWEICRESEHLLKPFDLLSHEFVTMHSSALDDFRKMAFEAGLKQLIIIPMKIKNTTTIVAVNFPNGDFENHASQCLPQIYQLTYAIFERFPNLLLWPKAGKLTPREVEILTLSAKGLTEAAIAERCGISINTVRNHVENSKVKLNARNKLHAVMIAAETREIDSLFG